MNSDSHRPFAQDPAMEAYFATLPKMVQEAIMQSHLPCKTEAQLRSTAENLMQGKIT